MKKNICILTVAFLIPHSVWAATLLGCQESSSKYIACKPGYYLENSTCKECPTDNITLPNATNNDSIVTSEDGNKTGISACYLKPTNGEQAYQDKNGSFTISANCSYTPGS